jgi:hypothetical protein
MLLLLSLLSAAAPPQEGPAADLVHRLGSSSFQVREAAAAGLRKLASAAEPALRAGLKGGSPEVRKRCQELLEDIARERRDAVLAAFLNDTEDRQSPPLSGWRRYRALFGKGASRKAFAAWYAAHGDVLEAIEKAPTEAARQVEEMATGLLGTALLPDHDAVTVQQTFLLLFLATDERTELPAKTVDALTLALEVIAHREDLRKAYLQEEVHRKVLLAYLQRYKAAEQVERALALAEAMHLKDAAPWALRIALAAEQPATVRARALLVLGEIGDKKDVPVLEGLFKSNLVVGERKVGKWTLRAELRDVALAAAWRLSGKGPLAEVGFPYAQLLPGVNTVPAPACLGFQDEATRDAAFRKYATGGATGKTKPPGK